MGTIVALALIRTASTRRCYVSPRIPEKREMRARGVLRHRPRRPEIFFPLRAGLAINRLRILKTRFRIILSESLR